MKKTLIWFCGIVIIAALSFLFLFSDSNDPVKRVQKVLEDETFCNNLIDMYYWMTGQNKELAIITRGGETRWCSLDTEIEPLRPWNDIAASILQNEHLIIRYSGFFQYSGPRAICYTSQIMEIYFMCDFSGREYTIRVSLQPLSARNERDKYRLLKTYSNNERESIYIYYYSGFSNFDHFWSEYFKPSSWE